MRATTSPSVISVDEALSVLGFGSYWLLSSSTVARVDSRMSTRCFRWFMLLDGLPCAGQFDAGAMGAQHRSQSFLVDCSGLALSCGSLDAGVRCRLLQFNLDPCRDEERARVSRATIWETPAKIIIIEIVSPDYDRASR